jgi:hypothetical protein
MIYKVFYAKGRFEKYISKTIFVKSFSEFKKDYFKILFLPWFMQISPMDKLTSFTWKSVLFMKTGFLLSYSVKLNFRKICILVELN